MILIHKNEETAQNNLLSDTDFKKRLDSFYALLDGIKESLIKKAIPSSYPTASFTDAMDLAITSNALSLIKSILDNNRYCITSALNIRSILEHYALILMDEAGEIHSEQKELFNEQYKLIEYTIYHNHDFGDNGKSIDREQMLENYKSACRAFEEKGYSQRKIDSFSRTPAPFLCQKKFNFNKVLKKHLPDYVDAYIYLSRYIHPSTYYQFRNESAHDQIILHVLTILLERYLKRNDLSPLLPFTRKAARIYDLKESPILNRLGCIPLRQRDILFEIAEKYSKIFRPDNYATNFFKEAARVFHDINSDFHFGLSENPKLKFKAVAEMLACFVKVRFNKIDPKRGSLLYLLMDRHEGLKDHEVRGDAVPDGLIDDAFGLYRDIYPKSTVSKVDFAKEFKMPNGYLIDENGKRVSLTDLVIHYFEELFGRDAKTPDGIVYSKLYAVLYSESQVMSHASGYLYFANRGALKEDFNIVSFLDTALLQILRGLMELYKFLAQINPSYETLTSFHTEKLEEMQQLIKEKHQLLRPLFVHQ